ncbi:MAG: DUF6867 family protein [Methyloligella sp. ZOD6]
MIWLSDDGPLVFLVLTVLIGGGAAYLAARGLALTWRPFRRVALYMLLLAGAVRFFHYALFDGRLLSVYYYLVTYLVLLAIAGLAYRLTRTNQMVRQYPWLYVRLGPLNWRER